MTSEPRDAQIEQDRAMQAADDRGMEMFAKLVVFGMAVAVVLSTVYAVWTLMGGGK